MFNQNGGSKIDTLIKLVLVFFLSLLSFSVGTFVGKQFSDSQHKMAEAEHETMEEDRDTASIPSETAKMEPSQPLTEDEITKLGEEFVNKEKKDSAPAHETNTAKKDAGHGHKEVKKPEATKEAKHEKKMSVRDEIASVAKRVAAGETVVAKSNPAPRTPSSLPKNQMTTAVGKFTVQVSSYPSEDEAKNNAQQLVDRGLSAFYVPGQVKDKTWYRVSVGKFETRDAAMKYREKLMNEAGVKTAIVQKIGQ